MHEPPFPDTEDVTDETYGPLKVACERVVQEVFGDRACVIRPGFIVGPNDPTDRFTYWVRRAGAGGEMLAPAPADYGLQWVDARDLAAFVLRLAEGATPGVYGVVDRAPTMTLGDLIAEAASAAGAETRVTWMDEAFLGDAFARRGGRRRSARGVPAVVARGAGVPRVRPEPGVRRRPPVPCPRGDRARHARVGSHARADLADASRARSRTRAVAAVGLARLRRSMSASPASQFAMSRSSVRSSWASGSS